MFKKNQVISADLIENALDSGYNIKPEFWPHDWYFFKKDGIVYSKHISVSKYDKLDYVFPKSEKYIVC